MESANAVPANHEVIAVHGEIHRWIEVWYVAYAILGALASGFAVILIPLVISGGGGTASQIGIAIAGQNIGALFAPLWGTLADRMRMYRGIFFSGFILIAVGFVGLTFVPGLISWLVCAFLIGFGTGGSNTVASLFVVEFAPREEWSKRIGWLQTFNAAGSVIGMALAGVLAPHTGTLVAALLVFPALILGKQGLPVADGPLHFTPLALPREILNNLLRHGGPTTTAAAAPSQPRFWHLAVFGALFTSRFGIFIAVWFLLSFAISSFSSLYPVLMLKSFHMDVTRSSLVMSAATVISLPLYNLAGRLVSRRGSLHILAMGTAVRAMALAGLAVIAFMHPYGAALPVSLFFGIFQGIWPLLSVASNNLAANLATVGKGEAMGMFNAMAAIGSAMGAIAGGELADIAGYAAVSMASSAELALTLWAIWGMSRTAATPASTS